VGVVDCDCTLTQSNRPGNGMPFKGSKLYLHNSRERERERCQEPHLTAGTKHNISQQNRIRRAHLSVNLLRSLSSNSEKKSSISAGDGESNSRLLLRRAILGVVLRVVLVVADFLEDNLGISFAFVSCCCVGGGVFGLLSLIVGTSNLVSRDWS